MKHTKPGKLALIYSRLVWPFFKWLASLATNKSHQVLCIECCERLGKRHEFYQLIYSVRGTFVCGECRRTFTAALIQDKTT